MPSSTLVSHPFVCFVSFVCRCLKPLLLPLPQLEDVEHWEQANFADHHNGSTWSGGGNSAPQLGGGNAVAALLVWTAATLKRGLGTAAGLGGPATSGGS